MAPVPLNLLATALGLGDHEHVAVVGGGGKTTTLRALASQLAGSVVLTTTTKMGADQANGFALRVDPSDADLQAAIRGGPVMVWKSIAGPKAIGVTPDNCDRWFAMFDHVLVEADGARHAPFKAPAPYEPVVPGSTTVLGSMIGVDAIGRVIADRCHRPLRVAALAGCQPYQRLSTSGAARVLTHPDGPRRACPESARMVVIVTKVDPPTAEVADDLASQVRALDPTVEVIEVAQQ